MPLECVRANVCRNFPGRPAKQKHEATLGVELFPLGGELYRDSSFVEAMCGVSVLPALCACLSVCFEYPVSLKEKCSHRCG